MGEGTQGQPAGWYQVDPFTLRYWDGGAWTDMTRPMPLTDTQLQQLLPPRRWHQRRWARRLIGLGVVLAIGLVANAIEEDKRSRTDLGSAQAGSQQEWIAYFNRSDDAVSIFNEAIDSNFSDSTFAAVLRALETMTDSPDPALNRTIELAISACDSGLAATCVTGIDQAAAKYNAALEEAERDGLLEISD